MFAHSKIYVVFREKVVVVPEVREVVEVIAVREVLLATDAEMKSQSQNQP